MKNIVNKIEIFLGFVFLLILFVVIMILLIILSPIFFLLFVFFKCINEYLSWVKSEVEIENDHPQIYLVRRENDGYEEKGNQE